MEVTWNDRGFSVTDWVSFWSLSFPALIVRRFDWIESTFKKRPQHGNTGGRAGCDRSRNHSGRL
jgi:hypothetical protein